MNEKTKKILCIAGFLFIVFLIAKRQKNEEEKNVTPDMRGGLIPEPLKPSWMRALKPSWMRDYFQSTIYYKNDPRFQEPLY